MKKLLAALLILCMVPVVSFADPALRQLHEDLFLDYWETLVSPSAPYVNKSENETLIVSDEFSVDILYRSDDEPHTIITMYNKDLGFDFVGFNMPVFIAFLGAEYRDAFLMSMASFVDGKGYWETSDGGGYVKITQEADYISVFVAVKR